MYNLLSNLSSFESKTRFFQQDGQSQNNRALGLWGGNCWSNHFFIKGAVAANLDLAIHVARSGKLTCKMMLSLQG